MYDVCLGLFFVLLLYGAICDVATFEIPNFVSVVGALLFLPATVGLDWEFSEILQHFLAGCMVFLLGLILFAVKVLGGGDVKVLSAAGVWSGFSNLLVLFFWVAVIGGVLTLILILFRQVAMPRRFQSLRWIARLHGHTGVPYGVAISFGTLLSFSEIYQQL
jgi:prepilin peptidase CpaA